MKEFKCPNCEGEDVRNLEVFYEQSTVKSTGVAVLVGTKGNYGVIPAMGTQQSLAASKYSPPQKDSVPQGLFVGWLLGATCVFICVLFGGGDSGGATFAFLGVLIVGTPVHYALRDSKAHKYNEDVWKPAFERWQQSFICQRCGEVFIPIKRSQVSASASLSRAHADIHSQMTTPDKCHQCGAQVGAGWQFCVSCGKSL